jgi:hypothetical protein
MLGAGAIPIFGGGENAVVAASRRVRMIVSVTLHLVIVPVIIPMLVCLHHLMFIRAAIVRAILRADQRRGQCGHCESR